MRGRMRALVRAGERSRKALAEAAGFACIVAGVWDVNAAAGTLAAGLVLLWYGNSR